MTLPAKMGSTADDSGLSNLIRLEGGGSKIPLSIPLQTMQKAKGLSQMKCSCGLGGVAGRPEKVMVVMVTAAASVPSSLTSTKAFWMILEMYAFLLASFELVIPLKSAVEASKASCVK